MFVHEVDDTIADLDAALLQLEKAIDDRDEAEIRRSLRSCLACLYEIRCYRNGADGSPEQGAYRVRAKRADGGKIAEAAVLLRGRLTHDVVEWSSSAPAVRHLFPAEDVYPSEHLLLGDRLRWARIEWRASDPGAKDGRQEAYNTLLNHNDVPSTLRAARDYLVADPGPSREQ